MINNPVFIGGPEVDQATPSITISSSGLITSSATQSAGIVKAGTKSATKQMTTQAAKTVTPTTSNQTAVASGVYTTGVITVKGDANLTAANIKSGTSIFGVNGSLTNYSLHTGCKPSAKEGYISISGVSSLPYYVIVWHSDGGSASTTYQVLRFGFLRRNKLQEILYTPSTKAWITWNETKTNFGLSGTTLKIYTTMYWDTTMIFDVLLVG